MRKIYRGLDYHKGRLILLLGIIILILSMCKPEYNDVQMRTFTTDTKTDTLKTDTLNGN